MIMENNELPEIVINKDNQSPILGKRNITVEEYYDLMHHLHTLESLGIGYGECKNAWYEGAEKDVTIDNFVLRKGSIVYIKFLYSLKTTTSANVDSDVISLNINNTGAKPIYYNGKTIIDNSIIKAGDIVTLLYDGEIYNLISVNRDFNPITIDSELSHISDNPVKNSTITDIINEKADGIHTHNHYDLKIPTIFEGYYDNNDGDGSLNVYPQILSPLSHMGGGNYIPQQLIDNDILIITFVIDIPAEYEININNMGYLPIYYRGYHIDAGVIKAGDTAIFRFSRSNNQIVLLNLDRDFNRGMDVYYGECNEPIYISKKSIAIDNFKLKNGVMVYIRFSINTLFSSTSVTLDINNTGGFPIYYRGSPLNGETDIDDSIRDNNIGILFMYNNGHYDIICADNGATRQPLPPQHKVTNFELGQTYAVCDAAENKINKNIEKFWVPCNEFGVDGGIVSVRFINNVCANANLTGEAGIKTRPIYHRGAPIEAGVIKAGDTATFIYDGESETYNLISII